MCNQCLVNIDLSVQVIFVWNYNIANENHSIIQYFFCYNHVQNCIIIDTYMILTINIVDKMSIEGL
jgi:hypothetical protein